jgi:MFS family permease
VNFLLNCVVAANIIGISWGTCIGWSSPAIAKMTSEDLSNSPLDFVPTADQLSWIGGFLPVGGLVGPIFFAPLPGLIGRKWSLLLNALFFIGSFLILIFTHDITSIYIARFLQGFGSGVVMVILPMYTGEIASAKCRGVLSSFIQIGLVSKLQ